VDKIARPLAKVMSVSLQDRTVPDDWHTANVTQIFKKGSKSVPGNNRLVSLTSVSCKLMESIIKNKVVRHLDRNGLIWHTQHGFTRGKSCATNLLAFLDKITSALDSGQAADVIDFA
jgi:Reverse transcriptase (RNA-dependent DNA polymerase)